VGKKKRIAVLISGRGSNMVSIVENLRSAKEPAGEVVFVFSNIADAPGLEKAGSLGIETLSFSHKNFSSRKEFDEAVATEIENREIDLICLAGYMRLLSKGFIRRFRNRIINIHPSLLPSFTGLDAQGQAFDWGVRYTGCTVHFVDEELDHGPIIIQRVVEILQDDTKESLTHRILEMEHQIYPEAVDLYCRDKLKVEGRKVSII
jgi:phosphoribosylglycinamide formyltransferase-1